MSLFLSRLNRELIVIGASSSSVDAGGQPIITPTTKGTVRGRIAPKVAPDEVNGLNLNPVVSEFIAVTSLPAGFDIVESDALVSDGETYDVVGVAILDGRVGPHHLELNLRRIS